MLDDHEIKFLASLAKSQSFDSMLRHGYTVGQLSRMLISLRREKLVDIGKNGYVLTREAAEYLSKELYERYARQQGDWIRPLKDTFEEQKGSFVPYIPQTLKNIKRRVGTR